MKSLSVCSWVLSGPFIWRDGPCKIFGVWFGPDLQLEKNWPEILEKVVAATELWQRKQLSLKSPTEAHGSHIYSLVVYRLLVLPIPCTILFKLERILFQFVWAKQFPLIGELGVTAEEGYSVWPWAPAIMMRFPSPGWSSRIPSGSARDCLQRNWLFRQSAAGAMHWKSLLTTPSFTARSCSRCASFLKVSWSAS